MSPRPVSEQFTGRGFFCCLFFCCLVFFVVCKRSSRSERFSCFLFSRADARDTRAAGRRAAGRMGAQ